jgi:two-component system response regulator FixJ
MALCQQMLHLLGPELQRRGITASVSGSAPALWADPVMLEQIVHNLVTNAMQALEGAGTPAPCIALLLQPAADQSQALLRVCDNGPGFAPEHLDRVFEPFFSTRAGGLGLGLPLCQTLAAGAGRQPAGAQPGISMDGVTGAELVLTLPLAGGTPVGPTLGPSRSDSMNMPPARPSPISTVSPLIHLVDDDEAVRQALALLIGTVGLRVQTWAHPQAFLDGFDRQAVGAIVLDVRMPGLSGLTVLDLLRQQGVDQPVVMLTGHGTVDMCRRAFKAGAAEFLEKPVDDEPCSRRCTTPCVSMCAPVSATPPGAKRASATPCCRRASARCCRSSWPGLTNKEVGRALTLSPRTVETHRTHLCRQAAGADAGADDPGLRAAGGRRSGGQTGVACPRRPDAAATSPQTYGWRRGARGWRETAVVFQEWRHG